MSLSTAEIREVVTDLADRLEGGTIVRIDQPEKHRLILHIRREEERYWLQFVASGQFSRLHLLTHRPEKSEPAGGLGKVAWEHLQGSTVKKLRQVEGDRVVVLESQERDALLNASPVHLIAELVGTGSNVIIIDKDDTILGSLFTEDSQRRTIRPGETYQPLPPPPDVGEKARRNRFADAREEDDPLALSRAIEDLYADLERETEFEDRRSALLSRVEKQMDRLQERLIKLREEIEAAENAEELRRDGELLKIALHRLNGGEESIVVKDLFEPDTPEREIELRPELTPEQNVQKYFEEYKRRKDSREHVQKRKDATRKQIEKLKSAQSRIDKSESLEEVEQLKERLEQTGLLPPEGRPAGGQVEVDTSKPRQFTSRDGLDILVARNNQQNHELTFTISRGNDYWMHLLGWPGPHVIIRKPKGAGVPRQTLLDAAHLAIYYSKIRGTDYAEVVYTQRKYVKPIKGAGPGRVRYSNEQSLAVRFDRNRVRRLLAQKELAHT